jgi:hypothetical protein
VAALDAPYVATGAHLLPTEAGGVGHVVDGQLLGAQNLAGVEVGHGDLGGRDQPEVLLVVVVQVVQELGQLARVPHALLADDEGGVDLFVAARAVEVQHELDQRALQPRRRAVENVEAASRDPRAAIDVADGDEAAMMILHADADEVRVTAEDRVKRMLDSRQRSELRQDLGQGAPPCVNRPCGDPARDA